MEEEKKTHNKTKRHINPLYNEIFMLLFLGFSVLLTFCLYSSTFGDGVGEFFRGLMFGLFGIGAMLLPPVMIYYTFNRLFLKRKHRKGRIFWGGCAFLCLICLAHAITRDATLQTFSSDEVPQLYFTSGSAANGGLVGGMLGDVIYDSLGRPGAIFMYLIALAATCIMFSGRSLSAVTRTAGGYVYNFIVSILSSVLVEEQEVKKVPAPAQAPPAKAQARHLKLKKKTSPVQAKVNIPMPEAPPPVSIPKLKRKIKLPVIDAQAQADDKILLAFEDFQRKRPVKARVPAKAKTKEVNILHAANDAITVHGLVGESNAESAFMSQPVSDADSSRLHNIRVHSKKSAMIRSVPERVTNNEDDELLDKPSDWIDDLLAAQANARPYSDKEMDRPISVPKVTGRVLDGDIPVSDDYGSDLDSFSEPERDDNVFNISDRRSEVIVNSSQPLRSMSISEGMNDADIYKDYRLPPIDFLNRNPGYAATESRAQILDNSYKLEETLRSFKVEAKVVEVSVGPTVTRYELAPGQGVKVSSIANLSNDLALSLAASGIRIEAPIPGKSAVGIEIPNKEMQPVYLREIIEDEAFRRYSSKLAFAVGKDITGNTVVADIAKMPHLLIAGATGSGKSVCINTLITSILYKSKPNEVKLLMVDPKVVELSVYNGIPHLLAPVVTDCKKAAAALNWAVTEMDIRYNLFAESNVRDLKSYNAIKTEQGEPDVLPQIVIIIDELADLMMVAKGEIEELICRLAQKARAAGLHLIIATQRPSVDVITGLIKANIPSRLAFAVSSGTDSRTVLDMTGAEKLLGKGDMLFLPVGLNKPVRIQCGFISDREVENIVDFLREQSPAQVNTEMSERVTDTTRMNDLNDDLDTFYNEAVEFLISKGKGSASMLQRQFRIGYNRASRLIEELESRGIVGPEDGSKPRKVLITMEQWRNSR